MSQHVFDFETATALRDQGIARAIDHADRRIAKWSEIAYDALVAYARTHATLTTEQVRSVSDVPEPPDPRAWGGVALRARKAGLLAPHGFGQANNPLGHRRDIRVWQSRIYAGSAA